MVVSAATAKRHAGEICEWLQGAGPHRGQPEAALSGESCGRNRYAGRGLAGGEERNVSLSGIRVVDLTRILAGPFCTMLLADMGAEVVKIETPGQGDPLRGQGAIRDGLSWYFAAFNRNKKSVTLNLRSDAGRAALARLITESDVLVENYRPGVLAGMGFAPARLDALNPGLVTCSLSGFGDSGPYRDRPSFDFIAQAMSGFMSVTGEAG
ncbi:MAG: CoA transferase, partial [Alphaproteobacteria bacterium]|nr:CoA transferase [Alphaproteobacteria bacterium]